MAKFITNQVIRTGLSEHPAVKFWHDLGLGRVQPEAIVILKERRKMKKGKSAVYRLEGVGTAGMSVIAKRCQLATATIERTIYEDILPCLPVSRLEYFGIVDEPNGKNCWLFLEDAGELIYSPHVEEHRVAAAKWLGHMHISAAQVTTGVLLPDRGVRYYQKHLRDARDTILHNLDHASLVLDDVKVLESIVSLMNSIESHWHEAERFCKQFPSTLVHGDFAAKNVRLQNGSGGGAVVVFDWEYAGWGVPAADLKQVNLSTYWSVIQSAWSDVRIQDIQQLANFGKIFRCLASISWDSRRLEHPWVERVMKHMLVYESRLACLVRTAEWRA